MVFTSISFLIFFSLLTILYYCTPVKFKWLNLLLGSYFFYMNINPVYSFLLAGVTVSTYFFTLFISSVEAESKKRRYMITNIALSLLPLFFFKYFASINEGVFHILRSMHIRWPLPSMELLLPIGISFYTFMAIGYTIDVYNEEIEAEKNFGIVALFISFFPLILSGPIERAGNVLPQFKAPRRPDYNLIVEGMKFMLWGYFMKLVVADRLAIYVDAVYSNVSQHNGTSLLVTSLLYPFQVYADLGGYSLIAIGVARILGINVIQNFKRPFFATSMGEFWRRWHISLISWLSDYVYTPLSFSFRKYKMYGIIMALLITFLISGIWHSAKFTFIVWGLMQGIFISIEVLTSKRRITFENRYNLNKNRLYIFLRCVIVFLLFSASQIFARSDTMQDALLVYSKIFSQWGPLFYDNNPSLIIYSVTGILILFFADFKREYFPNEFSFFNSKSWVIRYTTYFALLLLTLTIGVFDGGQFIYFKF